MSDKIASADRNSSPAQTGDGQGRWLFPTTPDKDGQTPVLPPAAVTSLDDLRQMMTALLRTGEQFGDDDDLLDVGLDSLGAMMAVQSLNAGGHRVSYPQLALATTLREWWATIKAD